VLVEESQILTEEQITELEALIAARKEEREAGDGPERPDFQARLFEALDITDDQNEAMQPLFDANAALRETMRTQRQAFKAYTKELLEQEEFDANAWLTQFDIEAPLMRETALAIANNTHSIYALLTEEQQDQLKRIIRRATGDNRSERRGNRRG
jgi:Spy/CpxP family protein refolding chaperone